MAQVPAVLLHAFRFKGRRLENLAFTLRCHLISRASTTRGSRRLQPEGPSKSVAACQPPLPQPGLLLQQALLSAALGGASTDELQEGQLQGPKARTPGLLPHFRGAHPERRVSRKVVHTPSEAKLRRKACLLWERSKMFIPIGDTRVYDDASGATDGMGRALPGISL